MKSTTAILAEDEPALLDQLVELLRAVWPELDIIGTAANGIEALRLLEQHRPDVLFLDIAMPGASGLDVARHAAPGCRIVFVTAYDQHAVAAFEHGAIDYVLKPLTAARLYATVGRLKERLLAAAPGSAPAQASGAAPDQLAANAGSAAGRAPLRWINASVGQNLRLITVDEVLFFQADSKYTRVVTQDGEALIRKPLKELVDELDAGQFWQIHRATVVNAAVVDRITRDIRGRLQVHLKRHAETLLVSESYAHRFRQM